MSGKTQPTPWSELVSVLTEVTTTSALLGSVIPISVAIERPSVLSDTSDTCSTHQCPRSRTIVSTTAIGQERNVLENTASETTSTVMSHRMNKLLAKFQANG